MFDKDFLTTIEKLLIEEKTRTESQLEQFAKRSNKGDGEYETVYPEYGDDEGDNAAEAADYADSLSIEHALEKTLKDVNEALRRIQDGTYGVCKYCHKPISTERLLARPTSSACIPCKKNLTQEA